VHAAGHLERAPLVVLAVGDEHQRASAFVAATLVSLARHADLLHERRVEALGPRGGGLEAVALLRQVAAGDGSAVSRVLDRYGGLVWTLARRLTGDVSDAEDAVQEVFIDLWKSADRFDESVASESTFVAMIARRRLIDRRRKRDRQPDVQPLPERLEAGRDSESGAARAELKDDAERARQAMGRLRPEQQEVLRLAVVEGLTHQQISKKTEMPLGTVKTHARRGLIKIRELLEVRDADAAEGVAG